MGPVYLFRTSIFLLAFYSSILFFSLEQALHIFFDSTSIVRYTS